LGLRPRLELRLYSEEHLDLVRHQHLDPVQELLPLAHRQHLEVAALVCLVRQLSQLSKKIMIKLIEFLF
jgi:hypothetical protein